jgi:hypothetical protein
MLGKQTVFCALVAVAAPRDSVLIQNGAAQSPAQPKQILAQEQVLNELS